MAHTQVCYDLYNQYVHSQASPGPVQGHVLLFAGSVRVLEAEHAYYADMDFLRFCACRRPICSLYGPVQGPYMSNDNAQVWPGIYNQYVAHTAELMGIRKPVWDPNGPVRCPRDL